MLVNSHIVINEECQEPLLSTSTAINREICFNWSLVGYQLNNRLTADV